MERNVLYKQHPAIACCHLMNIHGQHQPTCEILEDFTAFGSYQEDYLRCRTDQLSRASYELSPLPTTPPFLNPSLNINCSKKRKTSRTVWLSLTLPPKCSLERTHKQMSQNLSNPQSMFCTKIPLLLLHGRKCKREMYFPHWGILMAFFQYLHFKSS